ncbi:MULTISPECIES: serine hydrolase [unclassified Streptomyces]|jgi:D-alanyl-D-alanine carboxypeptidase (penicillin-binding protein 5/6)|uniref:D-alanyl-D-alanine carboxypeptidase family protein n=1 Tax=unclassified Streptomyces TaxID=2593676 RepID=UPI0033B4BADA
MIHGFSSRTLLSVCALSVAGVLALPPAASAAGGTASGGAAGAGPVAAGGAEPTPGGPRAALPEASLLYRPGVQVRLRAGAPRVPSVSALSWVVADADSGDVLAAYAAHRKLPPASTLKTLFALTVLPSLPAGQEHTVRPEELEGIGPGSSLVGVAEGHTYRIADLWRGVFLNSGNDAVHVLASLDGGWEATAERMQATARALGAHDTHVRSPDGYDTPGQVSSAFDLAVFGRAGLHNADFARYCRTVEAQFPGGGGWTYGIQNTNRLLTGADGVEPYPGLIGIKNGYTTNAGNTLIAAAHRGGRTLVVTVMNPQEGGAFAVYEEARALLDWGFAAAGRVDPVGSLDALRSRPQPGPAATPTPTPTPTAVSAADAVAVAHTDEPDGSGWGSAAAFTAAACLGAGGLLLARRRKGGRGDTP